MREVLAEQKISAPVRVLDIATEAEAVQHRFLGSPTIQICGVDIDPEVRGFDDYGLG